MPMFDYACASAECKHHRIILQRSWKDPAPDHCGSPMVKQISTGTSATFQRGGFSSSSPGGING